MEKMFLFNALIDDRPHADTAGLRRHCKRTEPAGGKRIHQFLRNRIGPEGGYRH